MRHNSYNIEVSLMCACCGMQLVISEKIRILKVDSKFSCNHCGCKRTNYLVYCGATRRKIENRFP